MIAVGQTAWCDHHAGVAALTARAGQLHPTADEGLRRTLDQPAGDRPARGRPMRVVYVPDMRREIVDHFRQDPGPLDNQGLGRGHGVEGR